MTGEDMRIAKYLASCGLGSRRKCEEIIAMGKVSVNGKAITSPALNIDPREDKISFKNKFIEPQKKVYYLLYKPVGYTCSLADDKAKRLITELVPGTEFVWPVGRLDRETSGLIIMTNDGDLTQKLTHPSHEKSKTYIAKIDKSLSSSQIETFISGIELEDGRMKPDALKSLGDFEYEITVHEGRNRLVRRSFEHFARKVGALTRVKLSFLEIGSLKPGKFRRLNMQEVERLRHA
jgi:23S rRNA pseudouridine2605 synthase